MTSIMTGGLDNAPARPGMFWRGARGFLRILAGMLLFLVTPAWFVIAHAVDVPQIFAWPAWYAWVTSFMGVVLWGRGWTLCRQARDNLRRACDEWEPLEKRHQDVERSCVALLESGHYHRGLAARWEAACAERETLRAQIAAGTSVPFLASLSAATARETGAIVEYFHGLMDAHDLFALAPAWRGIWENETGAVYEDLTVLETLTESVQRRSREPMVLSTAASLVAWVNEQRVAVSNLAASIERAQMDPAEALTQLDRIADEARVRLVRLIEVALATDTSMIGQRRYKRWRRGAGEKLRTNETRYIGAYRISGMTYTYNPAQAIRLTANSAGIDFKGSAAHSTALFTAFNATVYVPPAYLHRYLVWDGTSRYGSSRANYLTSAANIGPHGRTR